MKTVFTALAYVVLVAMLWVTFPIWIIPYMILTEDREDGE